MLAQFSWMLSLDGTWSADGYSFGWGGCCRCGSSGYYCLCCYSLASSWIDIDACYGGIGTPLLMLLCKSSGDFTSVLRLQHHTSSNTTAVTKKMPPMIMPAMAPPESPVDNAVVL